MDAHPGRLAARIGPVRAGVALALVGSLLLGLGLFQTSSAAAQPECPTGTVLAAKFTWQDGTDSYAFDEPAGNDGVVTLSGADTAGGTWAATRTISTVIVKGGPGSKDITSTPATTSGTFSSEDLADSAGTTPAIESLWFCAPSPFNPSTAAGGFNVVTSGDARLAANESEGPIAVGGDLSFDQYQVAIHSAGSFKVAASDAAPTALLVRGKVLLGASAGQLSVQQGWVAIGDGTGVEAKRQNSNQLTVNATGAAVNATPSVFGQNDSQPLPTAIRTSSFDVAGVFAQWRTLAAGLGVCPSTVTLAGANSSTSPWTGGDAYIYPTGTGQQVLRVGADTLSRLTSLTFRDGATPSATRPLVIDVTGVPAGWNPPKLNGDSNTIARYVIWNFGTAGSVTINGSTELAGTVLLPDGTLDQEGNGNLVGAIYSGSFVHNGGAEVHDHPFDTTVVPCGVTPPSTSTTQPYPTTSTTTAPTTTTSTSTTTSTTTSTIPDTTTTTVPDTTTTVPDSTTTSTPGTTTTVPDTSTTSTTTSTSTTSTSTSTVPDSSTSSTVAPTSSAAPTSSTPDPTTTVSPTSTVPVEVAEEVAVQTSITPDDEARAVSRDTPRALAWTGSVSVPMAVLGLALLLAGVTLILVNRQRTRHQRS